MSRQLRLEFPGGLYHVTQRGNNRQPIFLSDEDHRVFLELLGKTVNRFAWILTAYVLMWNHFHFVVQLTCNSLSRGMQWFGTNYVRYFNRVHGRVGHLYQGQPDMPLVEEETYGLNVLRYDVLNPVRASIADRPEDYIWSSHRAILGLTDPPDWLAVDDVLVNFAPTVEIARPLYKEFVDSAIGMECDPWKDLMGGLYLGSKDWIEKMREHVEVKPRSSEHPRAQRLVHIAPMVAIVKSVAETMTIDENRILYGRGGLPRMLAAWIGCKEALLTHGEIAAGLRIRSTSQVARLVRRMDEQLQGNGVLQGWVERCVSTIRGKQGEGQTGLNSSS